MSSRSSTFVDLMVESFSLLPRRQCACCFRHVLRHQVPASVRHRRTLVSVNGAPWLHAVEHHHSSSTMFSPTCQWSSTSRRLLLHPSRDAHPLPRAGHHHSSDNQPMLRPHYDMIPTWHVPASTGTSAGGSPLPLGEGRHERSSNRCLGGGKLDMGNDDSWSSGGDACVRRAEGSLTRSCTCARP
jgi:hypothetical protein